LVAAHEICVQPDAVVALGTDDVLAVQIVSTWRDYSKRILVRITTTNHTTRGDVVRLCVATHIRSMRIVRTLRMCSTGEECKHEEERQSVEAVLLLLLLVVGGGWHSNIGAEWWLRWRDCSLDGRLMRAIVVLLGAVGVGGLEKRVAKREERKKEENQERNGKKKRSSLIRTKVAGQVAYISWRSLCGECGMVRNRPPTTAFFGASRVS